jgi:hypothetical protein
LFYRALRRQVYKLSMLDADDAFFVSIWLSSRVKRETNTDDVLIR